MRNLPTVHGWCNRPLGLSLLMLLMCVAVGCSALRNARWPEPSITKPARGNFRANADGHFDRAESSYKTAIELEGKCHSNCVDYFYLTAVYCWPRIENAQSFEQINHRALDLYHSSLIKMVNAGKRFGRFDPQTGLRINLANGSQVIPTVFRGFVWEPSDFDDIAPVGEYQSKDLNHVYRCSKLGIPALATHCRRADERYRNERQQFSCSLVLRPNHTGTGEPNGFVLEVIDPLRVAATRVRGKSFPVTRDISAPIAHVLNTKERDYVQEFLHPGVSGQSDGLFMLEPYQPNKIPLIFVHGLLSDRLTWGNMANEIFACPEILDRYQIWGFEYATGEPFLSSAAILRRQLTEIQLKHGNNGQNSPLERTVLVGHSMGGLVSKLMITESSDCLWRSVSNCPLETINTSEVTKAQLAEAFFFRPHPMVARVIYIGTPHRGSPWAERPIGQIGAKLVEEPSSLKQEHEQLIRDNPNTFSTEFMRRIPTSIDLLKPDSPLLQAVDSLPKNESVKQHSVVGTWVPMIGAGDSDGVVPTQSALQDDTDTQLMVKSRHTRLNENEQCISELLTILKQHLAERWQ